MANIFKWSCTIPKKQAGLTFLKGIDGQWAIDISRGRELLKPFPPEAYFPMNPKHPKETKVGEQHYNLESMVVIGPRLSEFIKGLGDAAIQLLPVKILDLKGQVASSDFHIVHTTRTVDCIDPVASEAVWHPIDPEIMMSWKKTLTLKPGDHKFPKIFRITHIVSDLFVREDLAKEIEALGLKEPHFSPLERVS